MLILQSQSELLKAQMQREKVHPSFIQEESKNLDRDMLEKVMQEYSQDKRECALPKEKEASHFKHFKHGVQYEPKQRNELRHGVQPFHSQHTRRQTLNPTAPSPNLKGLHKSLSTL